MYTHYHAGRLDMVGAGAADGMQAGLVLGLIIGLAFGLRPGTGGAMTSRVLAGFNAGGLRARLPRFAVLGLAGGGIMGLGLAAALGQSQRALDPIALVGIYLAVGLVLGIVAALVSWVDDRSTQSPESRLAAARLTALGGAVVVGAAAGIGTAAATVPTFGVIAAVMVATMIVAGSRWGAFTAARLRLASAGHLPWRLTQFLRNVADLGILRQAGPVYQFRHARLRDRLANHRAARRATPTSAPAAGTPEDARLALGTAARRTTRDRLVRVTVPLVVVALAAAVLPALQPRADRHRYPEFESALATASYPEWWIQGPIDQDSQLPATLPHGYAVRNVQTVWGPGSAGIRLVGIAYVLVSCTGMYGFYRDTPLNKKGTRLVALEEGYSVAVHTGYLCLNAIEILVRNGKALCFVNRAYLGTVPVPGPLGRPLPAPQLVVFSDGGPTTADIDSSVLGELP